MYTFVHPSLAFIQTQQLLSSDSKVGVDYFCGLLGLPEDILLSTGDISVGQYNANICNILHLSFVQIQSLHIHT